METAQPQTIDILSLQSQSQPIYMTEDELQKLLASIPGARIVSTRPLPSGLPKPEITQNPGIANNPRAGNIPSTKLISHTNGWLHSASDSTSSRNANGNEVTQSSVVSNAIPCIQSNPTISNATEFPIELDFLEDTMARFSAVANEIISSTIPDNLLISSPTTQTNGTNSPKLQVKRNSERQIKTLVFFDLETTGLPQEVGKCNVQITEISMIAMDRQEFNDGAYSDLRDIRVMHKLSMCVRPRARVSLGAAKVTGLDNNKLIDLYPFDRNAATAINSFLSHLPKPVCLLAHNGNTFDYPLLKAEFRRLNIPLPQDLLIGDTLQAFKATSVPEQPSHKKLCKSVKYKNGKLSYTLENLHLYFFNKKPVGGHSSEGDCIALAKVCHMMKGDVLPWLDNNTSTLDAISSMW